MGRVPGGIVTHRIRELRFRAGEMTQKQLAESVGVSRQTIVAIEKSKHAPSLELAFKIAAAFGEPIESVFAYEVSGSISARE